MSATPIDTSKMLFETKYGNTINASPQSKGTTARCLRPYIRNPNPIDPNNNPQRSDEVFNELNSWPTPSYPERHQYKVLVTSVQLSTPQFHTLAAETNGLIHSYSAEIVGKHFQFHFLDSHMLCK
jgi:hypothetical protein